MKSWLNGEGWGRTRAEVQVAVSPPRSVVVHSLVRLLHRLAGRETNENLLSISVKHLPVSFPFPSPSPPETTQQELSHTMLFGGKSSL